MSLYSDTLFTISFIAYLLVHVYHFAMKHFAEYSNKHHTERNYFSPVLADFWGI